MLALFFGLGRFLGQFSLLAAFVTALGSFVRVWEPKIDGFGLPKLPRNPFKIHSKQTLLKTCASATIFSTFSFFVALRAFAAKCFKPSKNYGFVVLRAYQQCALVGAQTMKKCSKKPTENPSETKSEPSQNQCQKCIVFYHRFFRVSASILEGLGPPTWSQVGLKIEFR